MSDHVYRVTEVVGSSPESVHQAIRNGVARVARTVRNVEWFEATEIRGHVTDGEIDAFQGPRVPSSFVPGGPVRRLFADPVTAEKAYFAETGIFPIMHVVALRRDVYEKHPWVAQTLTKALLLAKQKAAAELYDASALRFMLPWLIPGLEEARALLGEDYWSYGLEANRHVLETFLRYHSDQGLSRRRYEPEELFAPEATEAFVI